MFKVCSIYQCFWASLGAAHTIPPHQSVREGNPLRSSVSQSVSQSVGIREGKMASERTTLLCLSTSMRSHGLPGKAWASRCRWLYNR